MKEPISIKLLRTLQQGVSRLSEEALGRMQQFVDTQRLEDGSFQNKSGQSDIYYTLFGWMLSYVLRLPSDRTKMKMYLDKQEADRMDLIHYATYMRCRMLLRLLEEGKGLFFLRSFLSTQVRALESFNAVPHQDRQSPYTQFIWISLLEDCSQAIKNKDVVLESLATYRITTGGYTNIGGGVDASTNATTAALAVMGQLSGYKENNDLRWLIANQDASGGYKATPVSPIPDLLSTATALFALNCYEAKPCFDAADFIEAHWLDSGGFAATLAEDTSDVEYTFYGLLALGTI